MFLLEGVIHWGFLKLFSYVARITFAEVQSRPFLSTKLQFSTRLILQKYNMKFKKSVFFFFETSMTVNKKQVEKTVPWQNNNLKYHFSSNLGSLYVYQKACRVEYCEFATKIQNAATKTALEGTAICMATHMIIKSTQEKVISGNKYSINPLPSSDTSITSRGRTLLNTERGRLLIYSTNTRHGFT